MAHDVNQRSGGRLGIARVRSLGVAAKHTRRETCRGAASTRRVGLAQDHMALEDVTLEDRLRVFKWNVRIGEFDHWRKRGDRGRGCGAVTPTRHIVPDV